MFHIPPYFRSQSVGEEWENGIVLGKAASRYDNDGPEENRGRLIDLVRITYSDNGEIAVKVFEIPEGYMLEVQKTFERASKCPYLSK